MSMRKALLSGFVAFAVLGFSMSAFAGVVFDGPTTATATGTVHILQQDSTSVGAAPETTVFTISPQPSVSCGTFSDFVISPNTVTDAQTRKNMVALLLLAKATGNPVEIAYDNSGGFCDQGMIAVYFIEML
jgi:hypothetical protein